MRHMARTRARSAAVGAQDKYPLIHLDFHQRVFRFNLTVTTYRQSHFSHLLNSS